MKVELKFLRRLLAVSSKEPGRPQIIRAATIIADGRWAATDGHCALYLTPPPSLAWTPNNKPIPLDVMIDGCLTGMLPTVTATGLQYPGEPEIAWPALTAIDCAKVIPSSEIVYQLNVSEFLREIDAALAAECAKYKIGIAKAYEIRSTFAKNRHAFQRVPKRTVTLAKDHVAFDIAGKWRASVKVNPLALPEGADALLETTIGTMEGARTLGLPYALLRKLAANHPTAVAAVRGKMEPIEIIGIDGLGLLMPIRF